MSKDIYQGREKELGLIAFATIFIFAVLSIAISSSILISSISLGVRVGFYYYLLYIIVVVADIFILTFSAAKLVAMYRGFLELISDIKRRGSASIPKSSGQPPIELSKNEEIILSIITGNGGRILQNAVVLSSGLSGATVTRILTSLEEKGVIEKTRHGMTNEIYLRDK